MSDKNCWVIVAIAGVTCGGKTTLAEKIQKSLPKCQIINQDVYFYPDDSPHHVKVELLDHNNYDILSSLDMEKMYKDVLKVISGNRSSGDKCNILVIEGFSILNYEPIAKLCNIKYEIVLSKEECLRRRNCRVYDPPDIPGYFELCVWPEYLKYHEELKKQKDIIPLDGAQSDFTERVLKDINLLCNKK